MSTPDRHLFGDGTFGFEFWNLVATIGAIIAGWVILLSSWNNAYGPRSSGSQAIRRPPDPDPWDARSLEWMTTNFAHS